MKFAERLQCRFHSGRSQEQICVLLRRSLSPSGDSRIALWDTSRLFPTPYFSGWAEKGAFELNPLEDGVKYTVLPVLSGTVEQNSDGAVVSVRAKMNPVGRVFLIILLGFLLLFFLFCLTRLSWKGMAVCTLLLVITAVVLHFAFYRPAAKALKFLQNLLK